MGQRLSTICLYTPGCTNVMWSTGENQMLFLQSKFRKYIVFAFFKTANAFENLMLKERCSTLNFFES